jgi:tetratricopeptide (TPR) repeat protein
MGTGLFVVAFISGAVQSWRLERRLPMIDLIVSGPEDHVDDLVTRQDYDRAIKQLTMQVRLQPDNAGAREHLGNLLGTQKRLDEAQVQFQELVRLRPDYAEGYSYLGSAYLDAGHLFLATNSFKRAIELNPDLPVAHNNLGVALARLSRGPDQSEPSPQITSRQSLAG